MMVRYFLFRKFARPALLILLLSLVTLARQDSSSPKRIEVKAGGVPLTVSGEVNKDKETIYVFYAKAGQKFSGRITKKDGNTGFSVTGPAGDALPEEEHDFNTSLNGTLDKTGDYKITVTTFEKRASRFTLAVSVR